MRLLFALSLILAVSLAGLLLLRSGEPPARVIPQNAEVTLESFSVPKAVPVRAQPVAAPHPEAPEAVPSGLRPAAPPVFEEPRSEAIPLEEAGCLLFGPVGERRLTKLRGRLERTGMLGRMLIERDDSALRTVYAGPYPARAKAAKALADLSERGLSNGALIDLGEGRWGVCIASTRSRATANRWAREAAAAWALTNVVVSDADAQKGMLRLVFPGLTPQESRRVREALSGAEGGTFEACGR